jgi:thiol-disulfide isomerase/thioredoxin
VIYACEKPDGSPARHEISRRRRTIALSQDISGRKHFQNALDSDERVCALFFASWCPYSRRFLPEFEKTAELYAKKFSSVKVDDQDDLCDEYSISVYPTVIFFDKGKVLDRVDGVLGVGIDVSRFSNSVEKCISGKGNK